MIRRIMLIAATAALLSSCATHREITRAEKKSTDDLPTLYDYQLLNKSFNAISLSQLTAALKDTDVVFVGEYHRNQASHLLQMRLFQSLHQQSKRPMVLAMEQFERDQQHVLNDYLNGNVGERYLIKEAPAWSNYQSSYRPLVEYAKQHGMPVIAANAPGKIIRCIGRQGTSYLSKLDNNEKGMVAAQPFADVQGYADKFFGLMGSSGHSKPGKRMQQSYLAQLTRDNTMAESIASVLKQKPGAKVVHLNGSFHSAGHLGAAGALKRMQPELKIAVITPIHQDGFEGFKKKNKEQNDFYYLLNRQPKAFVKTDYMKKIRGAMFAKAGEKAKSCQ